MYNYCEECYSNNNRITPLLNKKQCLEKHVQYICGNCGRAICFSENNRGLMRWNFPFKSLEIAKLYLRTAEYYCKTNCEIYQLIKNNRIFYKIFIDKSYLDHYLNKNKEIIINSKLPIFKNNEFKIYENTKIKKLDKKEIQEYLNNI